MLKVKQQIESEQVSEMEKNKPIELNEIKPITVAVVEKKVDTEAIKATEKAAEESKAKQAVEAEKKAAEEAAVAAKKAEVQKKQDAEKSRLAEIELKKQQEIKKKQEAEIKKKEAAKAAETKKQEAALQGKLAKMTQELDSFSVTLNKKHFDNAIAIKEEIKTEGFEDPAVKVNTVQIYKKSFTFPQIANNDYAVEQLDGLAIAEQNLNNDIANADTMENFVKTADEVAHNLSERYKEQWVDPKDDRN